MYQNKAAPQKDAPPVAVNEIKSSSTAIRDVHHWMIWYKGVIKPSEKKGMRGYPAFSCSISMTDSI